MKWGAPMEKGMRSNIPVNIICQSIAVFLAMAFLLYPQNSVEQISKPGEKSDLLEQFIDKGLQSFFCAFVIDPQNTSVLFAGTSHGIFKSVDGGEHWSADGLKDISLYSLATDPTRPKTVYAGAGDGTIFRSIDGGENWIAIRNIDGPFWSHVRVMAIDPKNPKTIYAGTNDGMLRSTDGGESWYSINNGIKADDNIQALAIDPKHPEVIYAGTQYDRGLFKSINGGDSWQAINNGLSDLTIQNLAIDPAKTNKIFAVTKQGYLFKSNNGGKEWSEVGRKWPVKYPEARSEPTMTHGVNAIAYNPQKPGTIYMGTDVEGVYKSTNGGKSWRPMSDMWQMPQQIEYLIIDPVNPEIIYAASEWGYLFKSTDGGENWRMLARGYTILQ